MACPKHEPLKGHDNGRGEQKTHTNVNAFVKVERFEPSSLT
jgi:hypothetical protein